MTFITLSRQIGSKGTQIGKLVAEELQISLYDTGDIEKKATELGVLADVREVDDKAPTLFKRIFSRQSDVWLDHLNSILFALLKNGSAILLGRGGNVILRSIPQALHFRVIASEEKRIGNLLERGYKKEEALMLMKASDQERSNFIRFAFKMDWNNPELYDMVLNTDHLSVDAAVKTILCAVRLRESQCLADNMGDPLELLDLAIRVRAALRKRVALLPTSHVSPYVEAPGKVRLTGVVQVPREKYDSELAAMEVDGVLEVQNDLAVTGM